MSQINPYTPKRVQTVPMMDTKNRSFASVITVVGCFAAALVMYNMKYSETFQTLEVDMVSADESLVKQADTIAVAIAEAETVGENKFAVKSPPKTQKLRKPIERKTAPKKKKQTVEHLFTGKKMSYIPGDGESFSKAVAPYAIRVAAETTIPPSVLIAQTMLESKNGESKLSFLYNNHFGYKCSENCRKPGHCVNMADDKPTDRFRCFANTEHAFKEYAKLLKLPRYKKARKAGNPYDAIVALKKGGYATDPNYVNAVYGVIKRYNLTKYDE